MIEVHAGAARLYQDDSLLLLPHLAPASVDLALTSPPYFNAKDYSQFGSYQDYLDFISQSLSGLARVLKPGRILALNVSCVISARTDRRDESIRWPIPFDCVHLARLAGFQFVDDIIWEKPDGASTRAIKFAHHRRPVAYKPFQVTEYLLIFRRQGGGLIDEVIRSHDADTIEASLVPDGYERTNVWKIAPQRVEGHPAPFPLALAERVIRYYSFIGDTVIDCFMGSGTAGEAALRLARRFVGIEQDEGYFQLALHRLAALAVDAHPKG